MDAGPSYIAKSDTLGRIRFDSDGRKGIKQLRDRGCMSYCLSERLSMARLCASADRMVLNVTFDDASFLTAALKGKGKGKGGVRIETVEDDDVPDGEQKGAGKGKQRKVSSRRKITVVLGLLQDCFFRMKGSLGSALPSLTGVQVRLASLHSPGQVLPQANWATIRNRLQRWLLFSSVGVGPCRDTPQREVNEALELVAQKVIIFSRDALPANTAVIAREQQVWALQNAMNWASGVLSHVFSVSIDCMHHQGSLANLDCKYYLICVVAVIFDSGFFIP
jgi:hypothetical protein